jgi:hypothetical protein
MQAVIIYHPKSEHGGQVQDYKHDYQKIKGKKLELISLETVEGAEMAKLYDVTSYPAVLVIGQDGVLQKMWQGGLPLMNDVESYFHG